MTTRTLLLTTVLMAAAVPIVAQTPAPRSATPVAPAAPVAPRSATQPELAIPPPPPPAPPAPPSAALARRGQPVNVKVEFTLTDSRGSGAAPVKRTVSIIVADQHTGQIRSTSDVFGVAGSVPLNVDTTPELLGDGKIRVGFNLQYDWAVPVESGATATPRGTVLKTSMHDSVSLVLENGKPLVAAQSADPSGDRQVTVEVMATILK